MSLKQPNRHGIRLYIMRNKLRILSLYTLIVRLTAYAGDGRAVVDRGRPRAVVWTHLSFAAGRQLLTPDTARRCESIVPLHYAHAVLCVLAEGRRILIMDQQPWSS